MENQEQTKNNKGVWTIVILIVLALIIAMSVFMYFYLKERDVDIKIPFFPQGDSSTTTPVIDNPTTPSTPITPTTENLPRLRKIADGPVSGYGFFETASGTLMRFQEKSTGYVFEAEADKEGSAQVTNSLILRAYISKFISKDRIITSTVSNDLTSIKTLAGEIKGTGPDMTGTLSGVFLEEGMVTFSPSPEGNSVFYIVKTPSGSDWYIYDYVRKNKLKVYSSPLSEWRSQWPTKDTLYILAKPSNQAETALYSFSLINYQLKPIISGYGFIATTNASGESFISKYTKQGIVSEFVNTKTLSKVGTVSSALADKCAWVSSENILCGATASLGTSLPDSWYQGSVSFNDYLLSFDAKTGVANTISLMGNGEVSEEIDLYHPIASKNGRYLMFTNKKNGSLWLFDREGVVGR